MFAIVLATAAIIILIAFVRLNSFIVLFTVSLILGPAAGWPANKVVASSEAGAGLVSANVGTDIVPDTMLGERLAESGGATRSSSLSRALRRKNASIGP